MVTKRKADRNSERLRLVPKLNKETVKDLSAKPGAIGSRNRVPDFFQGARQF
jgi:hypothetical protein